MGGGVLPVTVPTKNLPLKMNNIDGTAGILSASERESANKLTPSAREDKIRDV